MSGGIFGSHNGRDTTGVCWAEAKDAAKHLTMHIIAIHNKEPSGPECQLCQGRERYSIVTSTWITTHSGRKRQNLISSISGPSCQLLLFLSVLHDVNDENQSKHQLNVSLSKISTLLQNQISPWPTQGTTWNTSYSGALRILTSQLPMALSPDRSVASEMFQYNSKQGIHMLWFWENFWDPRQIYPYITPSQTYSSPCTTYPNLRALKTGIQVTDLMCGRDS